MVIDQTRRPGSGRAACLRFEAPSRLGTAQHGSPRGQSYGRFGTTVQPRIPLSEAPIESADLATCGSPGVPRAAADLRGAGAVAPLPPQHDGSDPDPDPNPDPNPNPNLNP